MNNADICNMVIAAIDHSETYCWLAQPVNAFFDLNLFLYEHRNKEDLDKLGAGLSAAGFVLTHFDQLTVPSTIVIVNGNSVLHGMVVRKTPEGLHIDLLSDWNYSNSAGTIGFSKGVRILNPFDSTRKVFEARQSKANIELQDKNKALLELLGRHNLSDWCGDETLIALDELSRNLKSQHKITHGDAV